MPVLEVATAHAPVPVGPAGGLNDRPAREAAEDEGLAPGATRAEGGGHREVPEAPDPFRTCFGRDLDRIHHSLPFRCLAAK